MRRLIQTIVMMVWAAWFGGLIVLFLAVQSLFVTFSDDHTLAGAAASGIFWRFNRYQVILAALALIGSFIWRIAVKRGSITAIFSCFALAAMATVVVVGIITPRIEAMRLEQTTHTPEFARLHGEAMLLYVSETVCLLVGGFILPSALRGPAAT